jgi:hypothetical protein
MDELQFVLPDRFGSGPIYHHLPSMNGYLHAHQQIRLRKHQGKWQLHRWGTHTPDPIDAAIPVKNLDQFSGRRDHTISI